MEQDRWISAWKAVGLPVNVLGEQTAERISYELCNASLGITTTPFELVEKSGTVAAMLEHGLPVLSVSRRWNPGNVKTGNYLPKSIEYKTENLQSIFSLKKHAAIPDGVSIITRQFLDSLSLSD